MSESTTIQYERGDDGIVILTIDDPNQGANTMNRAYAELRRILQPSRRELFTS